MDVPPLVGGAAAKSRLDGRGRAFDPVEALRHALRDEGARDEGRTKRDGRTVQRIRLGWGIAYVDPDTYYPIEIRPAGPYAGVRPQGLPRIVRQIIEETPRAVIRFPTYEYLPRTPSNVALTNIRAQHPNATGP